MTDFPAWVVRDGAAAFETVDESFLDDLDTTIRVRFSSINYKDALALHGRPGVIRRTPLIPGIDATGEVVASRHPRWKAGDVVTLDGAGLGEQLHGGLAGLARVSGDDLVAVPREFSPLQAAAIGTAGFTAALAILALERHGIADGPILVTGASGGSGSVAIAMLAAAGYEVTAATGRPDAMRERLTAIGAAEIVDRAELAEQRRPLAKQRWAGVVDGAGGSVLAGALAQIREGGAAAAYGLAGGSDLPTTVMPFILRGVSLLGIDSVRAAPEARAAAWERLARDLDPAVLDAVTRIVPLAEARTAAGPLLEGRGTGRTVIAVD
ncbi:acryloyl-CoA reductase [Microbacterium indicum]|uniref:acrylyl-CoA reductase family protein n=1 Tax=Microbacterium indicum TaxID=358100 RepID=UPI0004219611|nr:acryloyl-CoA reductase [Microbacterium indicum]